MVGTTEPISGGMGFNDRRARISAKPAAREIIYGPKEDSNILRPLYETGGLLFPYTPTINDSATVQYDTYDPVHSNQPFAAFKSVAMKEIQCIGTFTSMNQDEARYSLAAIHFLRTATKMYFGFGSQAGESRKLRGTPPPILLFNAWGTAMYHNVPIVIVNYNVELIQDVDYVNVDTGQKGPTTIINDPATRAFTNQEISIRGGGISAWVPTRFTVSVTMQVQNTPDRLRKHFDLNKFRTGALIKKGGWI